MRNRTPATTKPEDVGLPKDVKAADLKRPKFDGGDELKYSEYPRIGDDTLYSLKFYYTTGFGWCLMTLPISKARRENRSDRSYGICVADEKIVRAGSGPHVLKEIEVHFLKSNVERLQQYVTLYEKGLASAGMIRDRISTRRAQGQLYRQQGFNSWRW